MQPSLAVSDRGTAVFGTDHGCPELNEFRADGLFAERTGVWAVMKFLSLRVECVT